MVEVVGSDGHSRRDQQDRNTSANAMHVRQDHSSSNETNQIGDEDGGMIGSPDELAKFRPLGLKMEKSPSFIDRIVQLRRQDSMHQGGLGLALEKYPSVVSNIVQSSQQDSVHQGEQLQTGSLKKQQKIDSLDELAKSRPLGLTLVKSPSFIDRTVQSCRQDSIHERGQLRIGGQKKRQKVKHETTIARDVRPKRIASCAGNLLEIGSWKRLPNHGDDLVFKIHFNTKNLVWEMQEDGLKNKIEFPWSSITAIRAIFSDDQPSVLDVELQEPPKFFRDSEPDPRRHRCWHDIGDFTGGEASIHRRHHLEFADRDGSFKKRYEELLGDYAQLSILNQKLFPSWRSPYFQKLHGASRNLPDKANTHGSTSLKPLSRQAGNWVSSLASDFVNSQPRNSLIPEMTSLGSLKLNSSITTAYSAPLATQISGLEYLNSSVGTAFSDPQRRRVIGSTVRNPRISDRDISFKERYEELLRDEAPLSILSKKTLPSWGPTNFLNLHDASRNLPYNSSTHGSRLSNPFSCQAGNCVPYQVSDFIIPQRQDMIQMRSLNSSMGIVPDMGHDMPYLMNPSPALSMFSLFGNGGMAPIQPRMTPLLNEGMSQSSLNFGMEPQVGGIPMINYANQETYITPQEVSDDNLRSYENLSWDRDFQTIKNCLLTDQPASSVLGDTRNEEEVLATMSSLAPLLGSADESNLQPRNFGGVNAGNNEDEANTVYQQTHPTPQQGGDDHN